ncbi:hypothetical protein ACFL96_01760 [Thermoproteota archaeon]
MQRIRIDRDITKQSRNIKQFKIFTSKGTVSAKIKRILEDPEISKQNLSFKHYLHSNNYIVNDKDLILLKENIENSIFNQIRYFCFLQYQLMIVSHNWGDAGKQQIQAAFCRNICKIPPNQPLSHYTFMEFNQIVESALKELGLDHKSVLEIEMEYADFSFKWAGITYTFHDINTLDRVLRFLGSKWFIQGGHYGHEKELILGEGRLKEMGEYEVIKLDRELQRSPNAIVAMAAAIGDRQIFVRTESLITIFHHKWEPVYNSLSFIHEPERLYPDELFKDSNQSEEYNNYLYRYISDWIKKQTLHYYQNSVSAEITGFQPVFIDDMSETILCHELGHGIIQNYILPLKIATAAEATKVCGENIVTALLEFLADFAPEHNGACGPFRNMAKIARKDMVRAMRMYYMYFSDTWFFDTEDEYMFLYSEFLALGFLNHINNDGTASFQRLALNTATHSEDYYKEKKRGRSSKLSMLDWGISRTVSIVEKIKAMARDAVYETENGALNFSKMSKVIHKELHSDMEDEAITNSYGYRTAFWTKLLDNLAKSSSKAHLLAELFETEKKQAVQDFLIYTAGLKQAEKYRYDARAYVVNKITELS